MSVNPGNAGQMYLPFVGEKITTLLKMKDEMNFQVYWDGACSADKIQKFAPMGMDGQLCFLVRKSLIGRLSKKYVVYR